jgi:hypothetical protein
MHRLEQIVQQSRNRVAFLQAKKRADRLTEAEQHELWSSWNFVGTPQTTGPDGTVSGGYMMTPLSVADEAEFVELCKFREWSF